jgi:CDP-glycerol glycerophosphotransferase
MDEYEEHIRGLYLDFKKIAPGPLLYNNEELVGAIKNINRVAEIYSQKAKEFYDKFCYLDNGNVTKKILERLF